MHWTWPDLMALPPHVYATLVEWLNDQHQQPMTDDDA